MRRVPDDPVPGSLDERFSDLLDGRLDAALEAELLARLRADPALAHEFAQFRRVVESLRNTPQEGLPQALRERILAATTAADVPVRAAGSRLLPIAASLLTAAAAVLLFFLLLPIERTHPPAYVADSASPDKRGGKLGFLEGEVRHDEDRASGDTPAQPQRKGEEQVAFTKQGLAPGSEPVVREAPGMQPGARFAGGKELKDDHGAPRPADPADAPTPALELAKKAAAPVQEEEKEAADLVAMARQQRTAPLEGDQRLSVLRVTITEPAAEASLQQWLRPLDVAFLPPSQVLDNRIGPVSLGVATALETAAAGQQEAGLGGRFGYGQDHVLLRLRGDRAQVRDLVIGLQGEAARFRPEETTIEGVAAREIQATGDWTRLPPGEGSTLLDLGERLGAVGGGNKQGSDERAKDRVAPAREPLPPAADPDPAKIAGGYQGQKSGGVADPAAPQRAAGDDAALKEKSRQRDEFAQSAPRPLGRAAQGAGGLGPGGPATGGPGTAGPRTPPPQGAAPTPAPVGGGGARPGDIGSRGGRPTTTASPAGAATRPADLIDYYLLIVRPRR